MPRNSLWRRLGCGLAVTAVLATCPVASAATNPDDVSVLFDIGKANSRITTVANSGTAVTRQQIVTANGGYLVARSSRTGGLAADYPDYDGSVGGRRAVVAITNAGATDELNPGAARFVFGADILRDSVSTGTSADNGNNVIQRGLASDTAQFKVQVDHGYAGCRVRGDLGELYIASSLFERPNTWYRVTCVRQVWARGDHLVLTVAPIDADGTLGSVVTDASGVLPVGNTGFVYGTPLSVGGKLSTDLTIVSASDQFNGRIDNAFLRIP